jgi:hypothetical protein
MLASGLAGRRHDVLRSKTLPARWGKVGLALMFFAVLATVVYFVTDVTSKYSDYPQVDLVQGTGRPTSLTVACAPREECAFRVLGSSLIGGWAVTEPLTVTLQVAGQDQSYEARAAGVGKQWYTSVAKRYEGFSIPASFRLPDEVAVRQTLTGHLTGAIVIPWERSSGGFQEDTHQLNIPVTINVVPAGEFKPPTFPHGYWLFGINGWFAIVIFVVGAVLWNRS